MNDDLEGYLKKAYGNGLVDIPKEVIYTDAGSLYDSFAQRARKNGFLSDDLNIYIGHFYSDTQIKEETPLYSNQYKVLSNEVLDKTGLTYNCHHWNNTLDPPDNMETLEKCDVLIIICSQFNLYYIKSNGLKNLIIFAKKNNIPVFIFKSHNDHYDIWTDVKIKVHKRKNVSFNNIFSIKGSTTITGQQLINKLIELHAGDIQDIESNFKPYNF